MICPNCKGNGSYYSRLFGRNLECSMCNGSGFVEEKKPQEQTNEGWLKSASTEELAEVILSLVLQNQFTFFNLNTGRKSVQDVINEIVRWLKEKHDDKN